VRGKDRDPIYFDGGSVNWREWVMSGIIRRATVPATKYAVIINGILIKRKKYFNT